MMEQMWSEDITRVHYCYVTVLNNSAMYIQPLIIHGCKNHNLHSTIHIPSRRPMDDTTCTTYSLSVYP